MRLQLPGKRAYRGLLIQDRAVGTDLDKRFVFVVAPDQTIQYRAVALGPIVDGLRVVRSGSTPGDRVVVNGLQRVRPGVKVEPVAGRDGRTPRPHATSPPSATRATAESEDAMKLARFFIDRPIFAAVLSLLILVGRRRWRCCACRSANTRAWCRRPSSCAPSIPAPTRR